MRNGLRLVLIVAMLTAGLAFASPASARLFIIAGEHPAEPEDAEDAQGVILSGKRSDDFCPKGQGAFWDVLDFDFAADGFFAQEACVGNHCPHEYHYHGILFDDDDPDPDACGWGAAIRYSRASDEVAADAEAITEEWLAIFSRKRKQAMEHVANALAELRDLKQQLSGDLKDAVKEAIELDEKAQSRYEDGTKSSARRKLRRALEYKRDILEELLED
jgi:hypothetical protein